MFLGILRLVFALNFQHDLPPLLKFDLLLFTMV